MRGITKNEEDLLSHVSMWGSDGYPIRKTSKGKWIWEEFFGVKGAPTIYNTKRAVTEAFEAFLDILRDAKAGRI